ncbi:hypothetical protein [Streptomyces sp. NPDC090994]|uniref:hypothetical protein n=1 Tax=Streptomyces sp. NPDC090994 TaxID=3365969 RepID=UPI0037F30541
MACRFRRKLAGRTISKAQLDNITAAVEQKFHPLDHIEYCITSGRYEHKNKSLASVTQRAGSPTIVRTFSIEAFSGRNSFRMSVKRSSIKLVAQGDDDYFAPGFVREIKSILEPQPTFVDKLLTHGVHIALRCLLSGATLAAAVAVLGTRQFAWNWITTALFSSLLLLYVERRLGSRVLLSDNAKEDWKRTEKLALAGVVVTLVVGAVTNGVNLARDTDGTTTPPESSVTASTTAHSLGDTRPDRDFAPSRSSRETLPPLIFPEPAAVHPGDTFILSGQRFMPGEDVHITARSGSCSHDSPGGRHTYRADSSGEIGPVEIAVEENECRRGHEGKVEIAARGSESKATVTTEVEIRASRP